MKTLSKGKQIHFYINDRKFTSAINPLLQNTLINIYDNCESLVNARRAFDNMSEPDVLSWNKIIAAYRRQGFTQEALTLFHKMQRTAIQPDHFTFSTILPVCANATSLKHGLEIHGKIIRCGCQSDIIVMNTLIDMYAKCNRVKKAHELFDKMPDRDVVSWTAILAGYARNGLFEKALHTFKQMQLADVNPNSATFATVLPVCSKIGALEQGIEIHQVIIESGFWSDVVVSNALIDMYSKCGIIQKSRDVFEKMYNADVVSWTAMITGYAQNGDLDEALRLFKEMPHRNVVSWTAIIGGYAQNGLVDKSFEMFEQMQSSGVKPNSATFASILPAFAKAGDLEHGMKIHQKIVECGLLSEATVVTALIDFYAKCGSMDKACEIFDRIPLRDVTSWNAMIAGHAYNGFFGMALESFKRMQFAGVKPDSTTFSSILHACAKVGALEQGMDIHQRYMEVDLMSDVVVATALVNMYAKCGSMAKACGIFDRMPKGDVILWNAMITGYAQNGFVDKALETFKQMQLAAVEPNSTTFASILPVCAKIGALEQGMDIHQSIKDRGILSDVSVATALIDMYAKCGSIDKAYELFDRMPEKNVISWNAMIAGYAQNGFCKDALKIFELMKHSGTHPNIVSFACILCACSHAGLVDEGCTYFNQMSNLYCITPADDHYACMADLLSRAGYLEDTLNFIIKMPVKPVVVVWLCFLGACRSHMNVGLGEFTATLLFDLDSKNAATYVLLSNIYAEVGRWGEVEMVRRLMKDRGIKKSPGCSWIEDNKMVHAFDVRDRTCPEEYNFYAKLKN